MSALELITDGGVFGLLANALGLVALGASIARVATKGRLGSTRGVAALIAGSILVALAGTGFGLRIASEALASSSASPEELARTWRIAVGIACLPLATGALWAAPSAVLLAWREPTA